MTNENNMKIKFEFRTKMEAIAYLAAKGFERLDNNYGQVVLENKQLSPSTSKRMRNGRYQIQHYNFAQYGLPASD